MKEVVINQPYIAPFTTDDGYRAQVYRLPTWCDAYEFLALYHRDDMPHHVGCARLWYEPHTFMFLSDEEFAQMVRQDVAETAANVEMKDRRLVAENTLTALTNDLIDPSS